MDLYFIEFKGCIIDKIKVSKDCIYRTINHKHIEVDGEIGKLIDGPCFRIQKLKFSHY